MKIGALLRLLNKDLQRDGEHVIKKAGRFAKLDSFNYVLDDNVDIVTLAKDRGVLREYQEVEIDDSDSDRTAEEDAVDAVDEFIRERVAEWKKGIPTRPLLDVLEKWAASLRERGD